MDVSVSVSLDSGILTEDNRSRLSKRNTGHLKDIYR